VSDKCKTCNDTGEERVGYGLMPCRECLWKRVSDQYTAKPSSSGWSCPRCSRIYGPSVQICTPCNAKVAVREVT